VAAPSSSLHSDPIVARNNYRRLRDTLGSPLLGTRHHRSDFRGANAARYSLVHSVSFKCRVSTDDQVLHTE